MATPPEATVPDCHVAVTAGNNRDPIYTLSPFIFSRNHRYHDWKDEFPEIDGEALRRTRQQFLGKGDLSCRLLSPPS